MKHLSRVFAFVAVVALAAALSGCEMIGFGNDGAGVPQVGEAKVQSPAISKDGTLRVGVNAANAPFSASADGRLVGIDVDIAAALAAEMGLNVEVVDVGSTPEAALEGKTVDVVMGLDTTNTSATCWLSDPYLATAIAIFATSSGAMLPTADGKQVIEAQESSMSAWEITNQFGEESLKAVPDLKTVFEDLENGSVTYGAADAVIGSYVSHTSAGNSMIIGLMQKAGGYCVGVSNTNEDLKKAVSAALKNLVDTGVVGVIESKWIGTELNLDAMALTEAASKINEKKESEKKKEEESSSSSSSKDTELGEVGTNAVDLQDDGSNAGETTEQQPAAQETYVDNTYVAPAPENTYVAPEADNTYVDPNAGTYVDPNAGANTDTGTTDAGTTDAGTTDAGTTDAGTTDAGTTDAGTVDAGTADAGTADAGAVDAGTTDTGVAEYVDPGTGDAGAATGDAGIEYV